MQSLIAPSISVSIMPAAFWLCWAAFLLTILLGCALPPARLPRFLLVNDKWLHGIAFFLLALPVLLVSGELGAMLLAALLLALLGIGIEIAQHFLPGRAFCWRDIAANAAGILLGLGIARLLQASLPIPS